jgi:hypothetical protein
LAEDLAAKVNGSKEKHKKIAAYYQSKISKDFDIPLHDKV